MIKPNFRDQRWKRMSKTDQFSPGRSDSKRRTTDKLFCGEEEAEFLKGQSVNQAQSFPQEFFVNISLLPSQTLAHHTLRFFASSQLNPVSSDIGYQLLLSLLPKPLPAQSRMMQRDPPHSLVGKLMRVNSSQAGAGCGKKGNLHCWGLGCSQSGDN